MQRPFRHRPRLETLEDRLNLSALLPPNSHAYGTTLQELGVHYSQWAIESGLAGGTDLSDQLGRVQFLPTDVTQPTAEFNVTLRPGTPFFATPFFVFGERYDDPNVRDDAPEDIKDLMIFETAQIQTVLDGKVVLEGTGTDLAKRMFGPTVFSEPIAYEDPQPRGPDLNAVAALFVQGVGTLFEPLPVGQHTLVNTVDSAFFGDLQFTYHITVSPQAAKAAPSPASIVSLGVPDRHEHERPFHAEGTGSFTSAENDFVATGTATHLGSFTHYGRLILAPTADPAVFTVSGVTTYEAANGDKLYARLDGTLNVMTGVVSGTDTWVGGTGRFVGARGAARITGQLLPDGSFTFELDGEIEF
jgi:hypothetical protein